MAYNLYTLVQLQTKEVFAQGDLDHLAMFLVKPELPTKEETVTQHPWANHIKDVYSNKIKYAHNSINNPTYPKKKETMPANLNRTKFTIIGDRVTKEFIYCVNLVKGLHKYKKKIFDAPVIRGVSTVEWPAVWNDLKIKYEGLAFCLTSQVAVLINDNFLGGDKELKELVETKFTYHLCLDYCKESVAQFANFTKRSGRPCAYMHIAINEEHVGTMIFMLYSDILPYTCENFLRLCKETKGGYSGTPIHRIVKDGWIQGGGFGLKETDLNCENFAVPHDRRGVLCMANAERHTQCSTQFFVLLQPAPWMANKYVAFGQLIEGKGTLDKIEAVPTWYESPTSEIIIYQAGIFNMDCHSFIISKGTNLFIDSHIEDLNALGVWVMAILLENVHLSVEVREVERLKELLGEGSNSESEESTGGVRETQRFNRKKEDIEKQLEKSSIGQPASGDSQRPKSASIPENNEYDVESYEDEGEQPSIKEYKHQSVCSGSEKEKPAIPHYLPLTDVPYPGEKDSNFDLKRFLQGDYCLESDLIKCVLVKNEPQPTIPKDIFQTDTESDDELEKLSLDSDDEKEIRKYVRNNVDRVSFAGSIVRNIAKGAAKINIFDGTRKSELITDDELRRWRVASADMKYYDPDEKKVSISVQNTKMRQSRIKRRQTGFVRPADLEKIRLIQKIRVDDNDDDDGYDGGGSRKVRITSSALSEPVKHKKRRPTAFVRKNEDDDESDQEVVRQSVLLRLFDDVAGDEEPPTLKDYKPLSEIHQRSNLLTFSTNYRIKSDESNREKYFRHSLTVEDNSYEQVLNIQHGKKAARKISTDYVNTIDKIHHRMESSIRSVEFAKTRPAISVTDYQMKNKQYHDGLKAEEVSSVRPLNHEEVVKSQF